MYKVQGPAMIVARRKHVVTMAPGGRSSNGRSAARVQGTALIVARRKHVVTEAAGGCNTKGRSAAGVKGPKENDPPEHGSSLRQEPDPKGGSSDVVAGTQHF